MLCSARIVKKRISTNLKLYIIQKTLHDCLYILFLQKGAFQTAILEFTLDYAKQSLPSSASDVVQRVSDYMHTSQ